MEKMKKKKAKTAATSSSTNRLRYIPEDLTIDIQRRLQTSCIPRLRWVSRSWNSILSNANFLYDSLFYGENESEPNSQILVATSYPNGLYTCLSYDTLDVLTSYLGFPCDPPGYQQDSRWRLGSSEGGLLCLIYYNYMDVGHLELGNMSVGLFNPATNNQLMLPPLRTSAAMFTVGFSLIEKQDDDDDDDDDDNGYGYKVVSVGSSRAGFSSFLNKVHVFCSEDELPGWRELPPLDSNLMMQENEIPQYGFTKKKKCYWIARNMCSATTIKVVSFDPSTEAFHVTGVFTRRSSLTLRSAYMVKEDVMVVLDSAVEVWALKQFEAGEFWYNLFVIPFPDYMSLNWTLKAVGMWKYGRVIYQVDGVDSLQILDVTSGQTFSGPFAFDTIPIHLLHLKM